MNLLWIKPAKGNGLIKISRPQSRERSFLFRTKAMQVLINGKPTRLKKSLTLEQLLKSLNINQEHSFAVALNAEVIAKTKLANIHVKDGDTVEIIRATAGG
jgi:thiamine biosynthesis protein ThiS